MKLNFDIHSLATRYIYPEMTKGMSLEEIKRNYPDLRRKVKQALYVSSMNGGISDLVNAGMSKEEAKDIYDKCKQFLI